MATHDTNAEGKTEAGTGPKSMNKRPALRHRESNEGEPRDHKDRGAGHVGWTDGEPNSVTAEDRGMRKTQSLEKQLCEKHVDLSTVAMRFPSVLRSPPPPLSGILVFLRSLFIFATHAACSCISSSPPVLQRPRLNASGMRVKHICRPATRPNMPQGFDPTRLDDCHECIKRATDRRAERRKACILCAHAVRQLQFFTGRGEKAPSPSRTQYF